MLAVKYYDLKFYVSLDTYVILMFACIYDLLNIKSKAFRFSHNLKF